MAPLEVFHSSFGVKVGTVERLAGDFNVGAGGGGGSSNPLIDTWVYRNVTTVADPGNGYFTLNSLLLALSQNYV
jgi:hypothetical protein